MKCENVKRFRECEVKPFKHTCQKSADKMQHLIGEKLIMVDLCDQKNYVYCKENLKQLHFYQIHRKDLKKTDS
jgi:hypothetical protein